MKKNNRSAQWNMIMNISPSFLGFPLLAALLSPSLMAADLQALDVAALPGDRVELKLTFDEQGIEIPYPQMSLHLKKEEKE